MSTVTIRTRRGFLATAGFAAAALALSWAPAMQAQQVPQTKQPRKIGIIGSGNQGGHSRGNDRLGARAFAPSLAVRRSSPSVRRHGRAPSS